MISTPVSFIWKPYGSLSRNYRSMEEELHNQLQKAGSIGEYPSLSFGVAIKKTVGEQT